MPSDQKVSVLMPVYNGGGHLSEAINSILVQSFRDFEFVIINDGSTDNSREIILSFNDPRIRLIDNPQNLKLIATLNVGLDESRGQYIVRMDADDISLPERLEKQVAFMDANPEVGLMGSWFENFGENLPSETVKYALTDPEIRIRHLYQTHISHPTAVLRKSVIEKNDLRFDAGFPHGEDYEFWVRMSRYCRLANYPECLVKKRDHVNNISNRYAAEQQHSCTLVKQKQFIEMGAELSGEEADLYSRFADPEWNFSATEMDRLEVLLTRISRANERSVFVPVDLYNRYLAKKWFHLCYHNGNIGKQGWQRSRRMPFSGSYSPSFGTSLKFRLKTVF